MKAKLNLTIDESLLQRIKKYAALNQVSISELVESYFQKLTSKKKKNLLELVDHLEKPKGTLPDDFKKSYYESKR